MKLITAAQLFKALSDPTRLRILALLHRCEMNGTDIADVLKVPRGRVARHLRYLYKSWLVNTRRDESQTYYALRAAEYPLHKLVSRNIIPKLGVLEQIDSDLKRASTM